MSHELCIEEQIRRTTTPDRPRLAVVGCGWWATEFHIPGLISYEKAELVGLVDADPDRLQAAHTAFGIATFRSISDLVSTVKVDGVVIATPSATHYRLALEALAAGCHVMVEKPMVLSASEAWDLVDRADRAGLHLQVGYTHHFTVSARRLGDVILGGEIGSILQVSGLYATMVESYYRGQPGDYEKVFNFSLTGPGASTYSDPQIAGGGQGMTQVTHLIAAILWTTGRRVTEVSAFMEDTDLAVDLVDAMAFRLDNGAVCTIGSTGNLRPGEPQQQEVRYYGSRGFALQDLVHATVEIYYADGRVEKVTEVEVGDPYPASATARGLADLIAGRGPNLAPGDLGARAAEFLEAAYASSNRGEHVRLDWNRGAESGKSQMKI